MSLTNMKMAKPEMPDGARTLATDEPEYPYGLLISLQEQQLAALGLGELPEAGDQFTLEARVTVVGTGSDADGAHRRLELQITDLCLHNDDEKSDAAIAGKIYTVPMQSGAGK